MVLASIDEILSNFDRLIELLQDSGADTSVISMVEDAREALLESIDDEDISDEAFYDED
tara:strand:- start:216 stop:392 length:177 start_codon:yes stop_codon:yes gene_type:complete